MKCSSVLGKGSATRRTSSIVTMRSARVYSPTGL
jgi:hypothetical protein